MGVNENYALRKVKDWVKYEKVRRSGKYNMFDRNARKESGLEKEDFKYCMENYTELKATYNDMVLEGLIPKEWD